MLWGEKLLILVPCYRILFSGRRQDETEDATSVTVLDNAVPQNVVPAADMLHRCLSSKVKIFDLGVFQILSRFFFGGNPVAQAKSIGYIALKLQLDFLAFSYVVFCSYQIL